jgi:hypothetical protein
MPHTDETERNEVPRDKSYSGAKKKGFLKNKLDTGVAALIVAILIALFGFLVAILFIIE